MQEFMERIGFPEEAQRFFLGLNASVTAEDLALFASLRLRWMAQPRNDDENEPVSAALTRWAEERGISPYSAQMFFLLLCEPTLRERYRQAGLSEERYYNTLRDLTEKLNDCYEGRGVWGTGVFFWFQRHFTLSLYGLGRMQYEPKTYDKAPFRLGSYEVRPGDRVYSVHIPTTGDFTERTRLESFRMAYDFFGIPKGDVLPVVCWSWILWPDNEGLFPEGNLRDFFRSFVILDKTETTQYHPPEVVFPESACVFGSREMTNLDALPADTTLRRNILAYLKGGNRIGWGYGILLFDGERILTKQG